MKKLIFITAILFSLFSCKKEKTTAEYKIVGTGMNINFVQYSSLDFSMVQLNDYNQPTFEYSWTGKYKNNIFFAINTADQSGIVKLYIDGKLEQEKTCPANQTGVTISFEN